MTEPGTLPDTQKMFVLLSEIRQCINDDKLMAAQRKIFAIEAILQAQATEPGTLPEGIERAIERYRLARIYTDPRTGDVSLCSLSLISYVSDLRDIARIARAEGAAQERARPVDSQPFEDWMTKQADTADERQRELTGDLRGWWQGRRDVLREILKAFRDSPLATRTPPPPEAKE